MMFIPRRVKDISGMVSYGTVCDIGCDHGYTLIDMAQTGRLIRGASCDINEGPLKRCRDNLLSAGLEGLIETRLSDGLTGISEGEFEACVIAGMGGMAIIDILSLDMAKTRSFKQLLLSPHRNVYGVRRFLTENGIAINDERVIIEHEKRYAVISCGGESGETYDEAELTFGKKLLERRDPELYITLKEGMEKYANKPPESPSRQYARLCEKTLEAW